MLSLGGERLLGGGGGRTCFMLSSTCVVFTPQGGWLLVVGARCVVLGAVLSVSNGPKLCGLISRKGGVLVMRSLTSGGHFPTCNGRGVVSLNSVTVCASARSIPLGRIFLSVGGGRGNTTMILSLGGTATSSLHTCLTRMLPAFSHSHMCPSSVGGLVI